MPQASIAFNKYANYLLYGKNNDSGSLGEYSRWSAYKFDTEINNNNEEYWKTADDLLIRAVELSPDDVALQNYQHNFQFYLTYRSTEQPSDEDILNFYRDHGADATKIYVEDFYTNKMNPLSYTASEYTNAKITQYSNLVDYIDAYAKAKCLNSSGITAPCPGINSETIMAYIEAMNTASDYAVQTIEELARMIVSDCWMLERRLANEENI